MFEPRGRERSGVGTGRGQVVRALGGDAGNKAQASRFGGATDGQIAPHDLALYQRITDEDVERGPGFSNRAAP